MTLWVDPPLLMAAGAAVDRLAPDPKFARGLEAVVLTGFLGTGVPLYLNQPWIDWFRRAFGAESGRDFMLNSLVFHFEHERPRRAVHVAAGAAFACYPLWLRAGSRLARRAAGDGGPAGRRRLGARRAGRGSAYPATGSKRNGRTFFLKPLKLLADHNTGPSVPRTPRRPLTPRRRGGF